MEEVPKVADPEPADLFNSVSERSIKRYFSEYKKRSRLDAMIELAWLENITRDAIAGCPIDAAFPKKTYRIKYWYHKGRTIIGG